MKTTIGLALVVPVLWLGFLFGQTRRDPGRDRQAITALEQEWLQAHDAATLDHILASDFVHVVPVDHFLTKQEHIDWVVQHPRPKSRHSKFGELNVRLFGDFAIVNGSVISTDDASKEVDHSMFTDVFVFRAGRWQAVNAQENQVQPPGEQKP